MTSRSCRARPPRLVRHRGRPVRAVDGVSLEHRRRRDAGPGRRVRVREVDARARRSSGSCPMGAADAGEVRYRDRNLLGVPRPRAAARCAARTSGLIFQEPMTRLDPLMTIEDHFLEALTRTSRTWRRSEMRRRALEALGGMGIPPTRFKQYPHEFSGGMRQRIMIALALVLNPKRRGRGRADDGARRDRRGADPRHPRRPAGELRRRAAADHPQPRDRRRGLRPRGGDVRRPDRRGGRRRRVFTEPAHPYTRELLRSIISLATTGLHYIPGAPPNLIDPPTACRFHPRCPHAMRVCAAKRPDRGRGRRGARQRIARPAGCTARRRRFPPGAPHRSSAARSRSRRRRDGQRTAVGSRRGRADGEPLLEVRDLARRGTRLRGSFLDRLRGREAGSVKAVDGVSFDAAAWRGARSGRRVRLGQDDAGAHPAWPGRRRRAARSGSTGREIAGLSERRLRPLRRRLQIVFQDPHASLNPGDDDRRVRRATRCGSTVSRESRRGCERRVAEVLERVGLAARGAVHGQVPDRPVGRAEAARGARQGDHPRARTS